MAIFCLATRSRRPQEAARQHHRRLYPRPQAGARQRPQGARRHDRAAQGGARAEPGADAGRHARLHPRRPVRQHRARLQLGGRDHDRAQARRLRGDRSRLRRRSRRARNSSTSSAARPASRPTASVLVATIRALKMHGGVKKEDLKKENLKALEAGMANLQRHVENVKKFGLPAVVSINRFSADTDAEIALVKEKCKALGVEALMADHWAMGGEGAADVAKAVVKTIDERQGQAQVALSRRDAAVREDPHHRQGNLPRRRRHRRQVGARTSSRPGRRWASASCRSASPRRSTRSRPIPTPRARRPASSSRCARCGSRPAPSSWWRSAARS